jgi:hypothetical protein
LFKDLRVFNNGNYGLYVYDACVITDCISYSNGHYGIRAADGAVITRCIARENGYRGIEAFNNSTITDCTVFYNSNAGIFVFQGCTVSGCVAFWNKGHGIQADSGSLIVGNTCYFQNGSDEDGAGIHVNGVSVRVEGNHVGYNNRGIDVDWPGNLIIRNSAGGNTTANYDIVADNAYGPIVNVAGVGDISGTTNANHPWANFEYD